MMTGVASFRERIAFRNSIAVAVGQAKVEKDQAELRDIGIGRRVGERPCPVHGMPVGSRMVAHCTADDLVVFDQQDAQGRHSERSVIGETKCCPVS